MKIVNPGYEILQCPDGEEALRLIERIGRVAYKSEDKIDDGRETCRCCGGGGAVDGIAVEGSRVLVGDPCIPCLGKGYVQAREPSSHKFVRMLLKTNRREKLIEAARSLLDRDSGNAEAVVDMILSDVRDNPAHESVIEHCSASILFTGNRGFSHELVRHRICAFTQSSTRYCNYSSGRFGSEITVTHRDETDLCGMLDVWLAGLRSSEEAYMKLVQGGVRPEIARDQLPQVLEADIVLTANFRELRHIIRMRTSPRAHPDARGLFIPLHNELRGRIPIIFDDLTCA